MDRILLLGGSFDPVHHGHLIIGRHIAEHFRIERLVLLPSASPPHKQDRVLAPAADRLAMCRLAIEGDPQFEVSDWETRQPGPNYTLHTVRHFQTTLEPPIAIYWLVGMDSLRELHTWYQVNELVDACTIVTAVRPGFDPPDRAKLAEHFSPAQVEKLLRHVIEGPRIDIAGTDIRQRVRTGRSIRYLVPEAVCRYIAAHRLYRQA